jgi:hypothetical protein
MMSDMVVDFDNSLRNGHVYLAEVSLPLQDAPDEAPSTIDADVYVVAASYYQALYIVQTMYPDNVGSSVNETPVTEYEYAARRNRGIL